MKKTTKAKAKKPAAVEPGTGEHDPLAYIKKYAPKLAEQRATLLPFDDVIVGASAGPQPGTKHYDPKEEPHFTIEVSAPLYPKCSYFFKVTQYGVTYDYGQWPGDGTLDIWDADQPYSMEALWEFLRQLPRPAHAFSK